MVYVLVGCIVLISFGLIAIIILRDAAQRAQVDELTNKLMSRSVGEYAAATSTIKHPPLPRQEKPRQQVDAFGL